ncbi:MAG: hypothetical protein K8L99_18325 [Anaerolineae bacterium]|nr:hypothetical protein [Anaerolineae bacterium]
MENFFDLPNPNELHCQIVQFGTHHSSLEVKVHTGIDDRELFRISFSLPQYVNCPMSWVGASFRKGKIEDFKLAFSSLTNGSHLADRYANSYDIFVANEYTLLPEERKIYIISAGGKLLKGEGQP